MECYAAYYDSKVRSISSSGGLFYVLAQSFDVVYGVAMSDDCYSAHFKRVVGEIDELIGAKYMQADLGNSFILAKNDLINGKRVLFTGTACQINGLKQFLGCEYANLVTVDIICHGAPSYKLWKKYVQSFECKYGKLESVNFRCKNNYISEKSEIFIPKYDNNFMKLYLHNFCLRPSCYNCISKKDKLSDITIGDFWGIESILPDFDDKKGVSSVIIRTKKGKEIFDEISNLLHYQSVSYENIVNANISEYSSPAYPSERMFFYRDLDNNSFDKVVSKYIKDEKVLFRRNKLKYVLKKFLNRFSIYDYGILLKFSKNK